MEFLWSQILFKFFKLLKPLFELQIFDAVTVLMSKSMHRKQNKSKNPLGEMNQLQ